MKRTLLSSAAVAVVFSICLAWTCTTAGQAPGQGPIAPMASAGQSPGGIGLVDVNYIFKRHARLKTQLQELQDEATKVQKNFEQQLQGLQEKGRELNGYKPGTEQYQHLEEQIVSQKAIIQGQIALKRKEFVQKEAHLYFNAYREISDEVNNFCLQHGLSLVLNFNGDSIHEDNPDDVARGISNKVVFYSKNLDITPYILPRFIDRPQGASTQNSPMGVYVSPTQR